MRIPTVESLIEEEERRIDDILKGMTSKYSIQHADEGLNNKTTSIENASVENKRIVQQHYLLENSDKE